MARAAAATAMKLHALASPLHAISARLPSAQQRKGVSLPIPAEPFSSNAAFSRRRLWGLGIRAQSSAASDNEKHLSPGRGILCEAPVDSGTEPSARGSGNGTSSAQSGVRGAPAVSAVGRKGRRTCYYHSQGLCTMMEDAAHLSKFSHEFPDFSLRGEDLKKVKAQPFDRFLVLDLEGMVEILEFPVVMLDAKTLQIVDHFHRLSPLLPRIDFKETCSSGEKEQLPVIRNQKANGLEVVCGFGQKTHYCTRFVRPAKMKEERIVDYIQNKYGRWGLDRVWHDTAIPFTDVLPEFESWLERHGLWESENKNKTLTAAAFVTCGNWDIKTKIPEQCYTSEIDLPVYFNEWINLKDIYFNFYKFRASGMLKMMKGLHLPMAGTHHVGLDDAINIARVLQRMLIHGAPIRITASRKAGDPKSVKFAFRFRIK